MIAGKFRLIMKGEFWFAAYLGLNFRVFETLCSEFKKRFLVVMALTYYLGPAKALIFGSLFHLLAFAAGNSKAS